MYFFKNNLRFFVLFIFSTVFFASLYYIYINIDFFSISKIHDSYLLLSSKVSENYLIYYSIFFLLYFLISVLALPIAGILCLIIGALFGLVPGMILASFASSLGALACFLLARYLFKSFIEKKFKKPLKVINKGIVENGTYYLFFVRMIPIFPFFLINLLFSVTKINVFHFYFVSQLGMLLGTFLFINAGTQLAKINSVEDIFSKYVIISFILIAFIPIVFKKIFNYYRAKKL